MKFRRGEQTTIEQEPHVLGVEVDAQSAALFNEFAEGRSLDALYAVWKDPEVTNPTIRQRAVAILTAPNGYSLPYAHPDQSIGRFLNINETIDGRSTSSLRERLHDRPDLAEETASGMLHWLNTTGGRSVTGTLDSRQYYVDATRQLLPLVSEPNCREITELLPVKRS